MAFLYPIIMEFNDISIEIGSPEGSPRYVYPDGSIYEGQWIWQTQWEGYFLDFHQEVDAECWNREYIFIYTFIFTVFGVTLKLDLLFLIDYHSLYHRSSFFTSSSIINHIDHLTINLHFLIDYIDDRAADVLQVPYY